VEILFLRGEKRWKKRLGTEDGKAAIKYKIAENEQLPKNRVKRQNPQHLPRVLCNI